MIYFGNPNATALPHMHSGREIAYIDTPEQGNLRPRVRWCGDNGVFSLSRAKKGIPWNGAGWWSWLQAQAKDADLAEFVVIPDVLNWFFKAEDGTVSPVVDDRFANVKGEFFPVGDHVATAELAKKWIGPMKALGFKVAFVIQDGCTSDEVPWDDIDAIFIGGSDDWKIGPFGIALDGTPKGEVPCAPLVKEAKRRGKWVHMGRVNSRKRLRMAALFLGCDSADGTYFRFGPAKNVPTMLANVREIAAELAAAA
jgi:hypothetical protein